MVRLLIRRGIKGVVDDNKTGSAPTIRPQLTRAQYADRAAAIMEQMSDLVARCESHDPQGAVMLVEQIEAASRAWLSQARKTNGSKRPVVRRRQRV
jgi:DNA-binding FadR family transcriptional regulator